MTEHTNPFIQEQMELEKLTPKTLVNLYDDLVTSGTDSEEDLITCLVIEKCLYEYFMIQCSRTRNHIRKTNPRLYIKLETYLYTD